MIVYDEVKRGELVVLPSLKMRRPANLISRNEDYELPVISVFKKEFVKYCRKLDRELGEIGGE
jgi:hypothetical protein